MLAPGDLITKRNLKGTRGEETPQAPYTEEEEEDTHTHARTRTHTHAHARAHTHTQPTTFMKPHHNTLCVYIYIYTAFCIAMLQLFEQLLLCSTSNDLHINH